MLTADDYRSVSPYWRSAVDAAVASGLSDADIDSRVNTYMARTGASGADQGWWGEQAVRRVLGLDADPATERAQQNAIAAADVANKAGNTGFLGALDRFLPTFGPIAVVAAPFAASAGLLGAAAAPGGSSAYALAAENIALAEASGGALTTSGGALTAAAPAASAGATLSAYDLAAENIALAEASGGTLETVGGALAPSSGLSLSTIGKTAYDLTRTALGTASTAAQIGAAYNRASSSQLPRASGIAPGGGAGQTFNFSSPVPAPSFGASSLGGEIADRAAAELPIANFTSSTPAVAIVAAMLAAIYFFARR